MGVGVWGGFPPSLYMTVQPLPPVPPRKVVLGEPVCFDERVETIIISLSYTFFFFSFFFFLLKRMEEEEGERRRVGGKEALPLSQLLLVLEGGGHFLFLLSRERENMEAGIGIWGWGKGNSGQKFGLEKGI